MVTVDPTRASTAAAILAGGLARRFGGRDKSRLVVEGRSIIVRQLEILQQVADEIVIVSPFASRFADLHLPIHADRIAGLGAIGGILTALEVTHADRVLVVACDLPYLDAGLLHHLADLASEGDGAWVRSERGVEPLLACYRREALAAVRSQIAAGRLKAGDLGSVLTMAELAGADLERFGPADRLLANLNTPEDLARLR
jgi:molybdenum cofactor guanylyltransferase